MLWPVIGGAYVAKTPGAIDSRYVAVRARGRKGESCRLERHLYREKPAETCPSVIIILKRRGVGKMCNAPFTVDVGEKCPSIKVKPCR